MLLMSNSSTAPSSEASSAARARASRYARSRVKSTRSSKSTFIRPGLGGTPPRVSRLMTASPVSTGRSAAAWRPTRSRRCGSSSELLAHPVRHHRSVFVGDVVADMIAVRVHEQRGVGCLTCDALRLFGWEEAIARAVDDEQRLRDLLEDPVEVETIRLLLRLLLVGGLGIEDITAARQWIERVPAFSEVVGAGEADDRVEAWLGGRRSRSIDGSHADAHQPDQAEGAVETDVRKVIEHRRDHGLPVRPDCEIDGVLRLPGTVDAEGRHPAAEELVLDAEHLFLRRVEARDDEHERRRGHASRAAEVAWDDVTLEWDVEAFRRGIEVRQAPPVDGYSLVAQRRVEGLVLEPQELAEVIAPSRSLV